MTVITNKGYPNEVHVTRLFAKALEATKELPPEAKKAIEALEHAVAAYFSAVAALARVELARRLGAADEVPSIDSLRQAVVAAAEALPPADAIRAAAALRSST